MDGQITYLLGNTGNLTICSSADGGATWSKPQDLTPAGDSTGWFLDAPAGISVHNGCLYFVAMWVSDTRCKGELSSVLTPVVLRARQRGEILLR
jgi:hypothetical protein